MASSNPCSRPHLVEQGLVIVVVVIRKKSKSNQKEKGFVGGYPVISTASPIAIPATKPDKWPTCIVFQVSACRKWNSSSLLRNLNM